VAEVAQICHCTPQTIHGYINRGILEALLSHDGGPDKAHRRTIRITRDQLKNFMVKNPTRFDQRTLEAWGVIERVAEIAPPKIPQLIQKPVESEKPAAEIKKPEPPKVEAPKPQQAVHFGYSDRQQTRVSKGEHCKIVVDGKVLIGDCSRRSAGGIVQNLINDPFYQTSTITIEIT
jgi:hypothetical protein